MQIIGIIMQIVLLPFVIIRGILLAITIFLAKTIPFLSLLTYSLLWANNFVLMVLSVGTINNLAFDGRLVSQAMDV